MLTLHTVCLVRYHTEWREIGTGTPFRTSRNVVLPCRYSRVQVRRFTAALLPHTHTHSKTSRRRRFCLEPSAVVVGRSVMLRGEAGVRRSWPAASRSLDSVCVWAVAVAVVDQVVFWRLASASGCRAGPVATVRKRRRRVPFSGKICRRRAWHRGERWVDGGAAFLWLGLSCPFPPLCWSCWTETPPEGPGPPRRGPVGGEWRGRGKPSSKSLSRDLLFKASMLAFSSPVCAPFSLIFNAGPCLPACLPAASPCALAGGIHGGRMSPMPGFSTDGILLRCILPNIASLRIFSSHAHGKRKNQPPTTATGTPAVQKEGHCRGDAEVVVVVPRPRLLLRTLFASSSAGDASGCVPHPIPPAGWAGLGWVWCVCGGAGLWWPKSHPQPTTSLPVREEPQAGAAASKHPQQAEEASRRCNFTSPQPLALHLPPLPLLISCAGGEQEKHYRTLLHTAEAVMVRSSEGDFEKGAV